MFDKFTFYVPNKNCKKTNELACADNMTDRAIAFRTQLKKDFPNQYFPKLNTSSRYDLPSSTKIEVSWPKLLYGNNLFEVGAVDFAACIQRLQVQLVKMGWEIDEWVLREAYTNNVEIALTVDLGNFPVELALQYLSTLKPPHRTMTLKYRDYEPGKQIFFRGKKREITFYDKRQELLAHQAEQYHLDWFFTFGDAPKNLLRAEIRLKKMYLQQLIGKKAPTVENCFTKELYDKTIQRNWLPFYNYNKHTLIALSPTAEIDLLGDTLTQQQQIDLLAVKSIVNEYGYNEAPRQLSKFGWSEAEIKQKMALLSKSKILATIGGEFNFMPLLHTAITNHTVLNTDKQFLYNQPTPFAFENYIEKDWFSCADTANYLGVSESFVRKLCAAGKLKHYKVGKLLRLRKEDVITYKLSRHNH